MRSNVHTEHTTVTSPTMLTTLAALFLICSKQLAFRYSCWTSKGVSVQLYLCSCVWERAGAGKHTWA